MTANKLGFVIVAAALIGDGEPGWLAQALSRTDPDVDAAVAAYEAEDMDLAIEHLDAATTRRGTRPEIEYDRGLALLAKGDIEGARTAFQHGTESDVLGVLASSRYELGNLAMTQEDWETAITEYIACLRAQPDHQNAKWNLELALQRKKDQEKKEQEEKEKNEQNEDQKNEDQENQDQQNQDQQNQDQQNQDQQNQDQQNQDQQNQDQQNQDQQNQDQQQQQPQEPKEQQAAPAKPIDSSDLDAALDQLDAQDEFLLGRPRGSRKPVDKDW